MKKEQMIFTGTDGAPLSAVLWLPEGTPVRILQAAHGMTEHMGRYDRLAAYLTDRGIALAGFDLRGHGESAAVPGCSADTASFGEGGWDASLADMHRFYQTLQSRFPGIPHDMLGFSLGSFLLREYLNRYNDRVDRAVIMGTGHQPGAVLAVLAGIVRGQAKKAGFDHTTPLVQKLSFDTYNQKFAPNRTPADWLCADPAQLDDYRADKLVKPHISAGLFWQLLCAMKRTGTKDAYKNWRKDLPVLLLSGQDDPVGDSGQGVRRVKDAMERAGLTHVQLQLYPGARHDLLHEEQSGAAVQARARLADWLLEKES